MSICVNCAKGHDNDQVCVNILYAFKVRALACCSGHIATMTHSLGCRLYVIHRCKKLKQLDFRKVKQKEREEAAQVFGSAQQPADGTAQEKANTFEPDEELAQAEAAAAAAQQQVCSPVHYLGTCTQHYIGHTTCCSCFLDAQHYM